MAKSADAFRTISEVSDWLDTPAHVLRFWESRFSQVKPVKRAGGRRYYRPNDMLLLGGIRRLLHDDGITIKGVQKIMREKGVKYVSSLSHDLPMTAGETANDAAPQPDRPETTPIEDILSGRPDDIAPDTAETSDTVNAAVAAARAKSNAENDIAENAARTSAAVAEAIAASMASDDADDENTAPEPDEPDRAALAAHHIRFGRPQPDTDETADAPRPENTHDRITVLYARLKHLYDRMHHDMLQG